MLGAVTSAPIPIAFQAAINPFGSRMPFIRFRPFKPLFIGRGFCWLKHVLVIGLGNMLALRGADFFVFEDWL